MRGSLSTARLVRVPSPDRFARSRSLASAFFRTAAEGGLSSPRKRGEVEIRNALPEFPMTLLETRDLTIRFGGHVAVNNVSCTFRPGELTAIVGPNGAGKTTYFNLISGQLRPLRRQYPVRWRRYHAAFHAAAHPRRPRPRLSAHQSVSQSERGGERPARRAVGQRRALRHAAAMDDADRPDRARRRHSRSGGARQPAQRGGDRAVPRRSAQARSRADDGAASRKSSCSTSRPPA